jgi:peptidoglycan/xylan/chitin deacetylase (PgdA/CDA1 family)
MRPPLFKIDHGELVKKNMNNNYQKKIRFYVIVGIVIVVFVSRFVYLGLQNYIFFDTGIISRSFKSIIYAEEYKNMQLASPLSSAINNSDMEVIDAGRSVPVLVYHGIPYVDLPNQYSITINNFKDQMFSLKRAGYETISIQDLYNYLQTGMNLPPKPVIVTFDDGRIDSFKSADPVLKALDFKATMFVIGRYTIQNERQKYYLSMKDIEKMQESGRWDIQAHSYDGHSSYPVSSNQDDGHFFSHKQWLAWENRLETNTEFTNRIKNDMEMVKVGLEKILKKPVVGFAYPYGDFGQNNTNYSRAKNTNLEISKDYYKMSFFQTDQVSRYSSNYYTKQHALDEIFLIKRMSVDTSWTGQQLLDSLNTSMAKKIPYTDNFTKNNGWTSYWGDINFQSNDLIISPIKEETGATVILDGSRLWGNYILRATVESPKRSSVYVWARLQDDNNSAACNFGNGFINIEQTYRGEKRTIAGERSEDFFIPDGQFVIEVRVRDRTIQCILNEKNMVETVYLEPDLFEGGIGFKTWSPTPGAAKLIIKNLSVTAI